MTPLRHLAVFALSICALACTDEIDGPVSEVDLSGEIPEDAELIAIGDSIFAWNAEEGRSAPDVVGAALGVPMTNRSEGGARVLDEEAPITEQYQDGDWVWLIMEGGGNDVNDLCGCGGCEDLMDEIMGEDGTSGVVPEFAESVAASGVKVLFMGYHGLPDDAAFGFDRCASELDSMKERGTAMANALEGVYFYDMSQVVNPSNREHYAEDMVHPSVEGSRVMGEALAEFIVDVETSGR